MQAKIRAILEKRDPVLWGKILKLVLYPAGLLYGAVMLVRRSLYKRQLFCRNRLPLPVISVGNLTAGGTGKTPFVLTLCRILREMGKKPAILLRGYGSDNPQKSDEVMLYRKFAPECGVFPGKNRVDSAHEAIREGYDILVLDDGFQHLRLLRDCDIVLVDSTCPFGGNMTLPAGLLREFPCTFGESDMICLTRTDQVSSGTIELIKERLLRYSSAPVLECSHRPNRLQCLDGAELPLSELVGRSVVALSGIGRPDAFASTLRELGSEVCRIVSFADHQKYSSELLHSTLSTLDRNWLVIVTDKDAVKLEQLDLKKEDRERILVLTVEMRVQGLRQLREILQTVLTNFPRIN